MIVLIDHDMLDTILRSIFFAISNTFDVLLFLTLMFAYFFKFCLH